jgi:uncharacterized protein
MVALTAEADWERGSAWRNRCQEAWAMPGILPVTWPFRPQSRAGAFGVHRLKRLLLDLPEQPVVRQLSDMPSDGRGVVWFEVDVVAEVGRRPRLSLKVQARLHLTCQRCLQAMLFNADERAMFEVGLASRAESGSGDIGEQADLEQPEELLVEDEFDLAGLIEDQLILAVPYVPRHEFCETTAPASSDETDTEKVSPFRVLGGLKPQQ